MKMSNNDLILIKQIINRWGDASEFSERMSYVGIDGQYVFITTSVSSGCLQDLFLNGFLVSCEFSTQYSNHIQLRIWSRR